MRTISIEVSRRTRYVFYIFSALIFAMCATRPASATWSAANAQSAWTAYQNTFIYLEPDGYSRVFMTDDSLSTPEDFWRQAEEIEVAEDAYNENPTTANKNMVQSLCDGFIYLHGDNWSSNVFNDDLGVAIIAFARAYLITGTGRWKTDAQNNYSTVWNRAQAGDGGLCEKTVTPPSCYENSSANWTFIIAAGLLNQIAPVGTGYGSQGTGVYNWAVANLYNSTTGEIYDAKGGVHGQYTYNYGYAMWAATFHSGSTMASNAATYVFNNLTNYDGITPGGYHLMPDYSNGGTILNGNDNGFNGILMRGVGVANAVGYIPSAVLLAAQDNLNEAWSNATIDPLIWDDWDAATSPSPFYSWNDSSALAGLLDIPPTL